MNKDDIKKGFQEAQKELKEEQIKHVKEIVKRTLKKIIIVSKERDELNRKLAILKKDIQDLKEGRLDRIEERQKKDPLALETSVAKVEKDKPSEKTEVHHHYHYDNRWYWPYRIEWIPQTPFYDSMGTIITNTSDGSGLSLATTGIADTFSINCSVAKDYTAGTYQMEDGSVNSIT